MMKEIIKRLGISILGLLQGTIGSYLALLGWAFAVPESAPGTKYYEEEISFAPIGYIIMALWLIVMVNSIVFLRKKKASLLTFLISWLIGFVFFVLMGMR